MGPGTLAGLCALLIWIGLYYILHPTSLIIATAILILESLLVGVWSDNVMEKYCGADPRTVSQQCKHPKQAVRLGMKKSHEGYS